MIFSVYWHFFINLSYIFSQTLGVEEDHLKFETERNPVPKLPKKAP